MHIPRFHGKDEFTDVKKKTYVGLQVTALGNPRLLERVSNGLLALRNLFRQFDKVA